VKCEEHRSDLMEIALGAGATPGLERHVATCAGCRAALEEDRRLLARIDGEVEATLQFAPSGGFLARVRQRVKEPRGFRWRWWLAPSAAAAAVALLALWRPVPAPIAPPPTPARPAAEPAPRVVQAPSSVNPVTVTPVSSQRASRRPAAPPEILVPVGESEALRRYLEDLRRQRTALAALRALGPVAAGAASTDMPPTALAPLPTQATVAAIDPAPAPKEIEIGLIRIALIGVEPLTMESWNEE